MKSRLFFHDGQVFLRVFSLPEKIIKYFLNNANAEVMRKLYQTCKYFYRKRPYFICDSIYFNVNKSRFELEKVYDCFDIYEREDLKLVKNIWVKDEIEIDYYYQWNELMVSKIIRCEARKISLMEDMQMTFDSFKILTISGKVEELSMKWVTVKSSQNDDVPIENLLQLVPNADKICIYYCHATPNTMNALFKIPWKRKFKKFTIKSSQDSIIFDAELLQKFIKENVLETQENKRKNIKRISGLPNEPPSKKPKLDEIGGKEEAQFITPNSKVNAEKGLPQPILHYFIKAANGNIMKKLYQTCKYFYNKAPFCIAKSLMFYDDSICAADSKEESVEDYLNRDNYWITEEIGFHDDENPESLISKISRIDAKKVELNLHPPLSYESFKFITKSAEEFKLRGHDNGEIYLSLEDTLFCLLNAKIIDMYPCQATSQTMSKLLSWPWKNQIKELKLAYINNLFDVNLFYEFMKIALAPKATVKLHFNDFEGNELGRMAFSRTMKSNIERWEPKKDKPWFQIITVEIMNDNDYW